MNGLSRILSLGLLLGALPLFADGRQIQGSGPPAKQPGRDVMEPQVRNRDVAQAKPGDYFWREIKSGQNGRVQYTDSATGKKWGWLTINQGDIDWAKRQDDDFMAGFKPMLPDIDDSGEKFMEYKKNDEHSRKLFASGVIEDVLTGYDEFQRTLAEFKERYPRPIPRRNTKISGATNWYYLDKVPSDFPPTFWAAINLEGRIMKVIVANGPGHRLAVSYWAQEDFMREHPNATWSWSGEDKKHSRDAVQIQEDISQTSGYYEFSDKPSGD
jgi:hypothetical protein